MPQTEVVVILQKFIDVVLLLSLESRELVLTQQAVETFYLNQIAFLVF
jgi:hypothetical protein